MLIYEIPTAEDIVRSFFAFLCSGIYRLIAFAYSLFIDVATFKVLSSDAFHEIYKRATLVLTIVMVFYITFEFVKYVIEPDTMTDKEKGAGKIASKVILVVLLLAFVPKIFSLAYDVQNTIILNGSISKIILGKKISDYGTTGRNFSWQILNGFYYYDGEDEDEDCGDVKCSGIVQLNGGTLISEGRLPYMTLGLNDKTGAIKVASGKVKNYKIHFDGLWATVVGTFIAAILLMYCVDVAVRAVQLVYLQIIAPIPIIGFLSPKKDGIFQKWCKQCVTTYLDIFIRLSLMYFILLICETLLKAESYDQYADSPFFVKVALIMGLLLFASRISKLLEELFPKMGAASGNFGLKAGERVAPMAARTLGAGLGGVTGLARKGYARARNEHARRKRIKEERIEEGKPIDRKSMRKELRTDRKAERQKRNTYKDQTGELQKRNAAYNKAKEELDNFDKEHKGQTLTTEQQARRAALQKNLADAQKRRDDFKRTSYSKAKNDYESARSQFAKDKNQNYGANVILQTAGAALGGLATGARQGAGLNKIEKVGDITKKVSEVGKTVQEQESARQTWLESGGGATIGGQIQRTVAQTQQKVGIRTESERIKQDVKDMEEEKKLLESQAAMEESSSKAQSTAEGRATGKIEKHEQKIGIGEWTGKTIKSPNGAGITVDGQKVQEVSISAKDGKTTSAVYSKYEAIANAAKARADAANDAVTRARLEGKSEEEIGQMEKTAKELTDEAEAARYVKEQVLKQLKEYSITRTLEAIASGDEAFVQEGDPVLMNNVNSMLAAIENARQNPQTIAYLQSYMDSLPDEDHRKGEIDAFIKNGTITSFTEFDDIQGILTGHAGSMRDESSSIAESIRIINESWATSAADANAAGGGKK